MNIFVSKRKLLLILIMVLTVVFAYLTSTLKLYDDPNHWPPGDHPYVMLNNELQTSFGGANLVTIMIARKDDGSIINHETLALVKRVTDRLLEVQGVIPYAVRSLSTVNARYLRGTDEMLDASLLFEEATRAPKSKDELERTEFGINNNRALKGVLVSPDFKSVIIQADFRTALDLTRLRKGLVLETTDPISIYKDVNEILQQKGDDKHYVTAAGSPIIIGWVNSDGLPYVWRAFFLVAIGMAFVLLIAFRSEVGIIAPLLLGIVATIWAFGLQVVFAGNVLSSSAALLAPFIIVAAAASHSVLFIKRFLTDELVGETQLDNALRGTLGHLMRPMLVALATDAIAFIVLAFVPFDNVAVLGRVTALGLVALMLLTPALVIALLAFWPIGRLRQLAVASQKRRTEAKSMIYVVTATVVRPLVYNRSAQLAVLIIAGVITLASFKPWYDTAVGGANGDRAGFDIGQDNTYAIHNFLTRSWEGNEIYEMEQEVKNRFGAVYALSLKAAAKESGGIKTPQALQALDKMGRTLEEHPNVPVVIGLPLFIKVMNRFMNSDEDEHFKIPEHKRAQMAINETLYFYTGGNPGAFDAIVDPTYQQAMILVFVTDTNHETVESVLARANQLVDEWDVEGTGVEVSVGGGSVGIAGAFNESIEKWLVLATLLSAVGSFVAAALLLRSLVGPLLLLVPLILGMITWTALVYLIGIEFNSNVTAALAIATGVGIDAEVYLLYRFREEYVKDQEFSRALFDAFTLVREPLIFSFAALFFGLLSVSMVPLYVGYVGFSMALVLLCTFTYSFFVAPVLWAMLQPKFLTRGLGLSETQPASTGN